MKLGNLTKAAMVVAMMMGQVTTPASDSGYYEDDGDFNAVSSVLSGGWGWGLNKAHATTCDTFEGTGQCENTGGEWDGEVIVVIGEQQDDPWGGSGPPDDSSYYEDTHSGGGGSNPDEEPIVPAPDPAPSTDEEILALLKEINSCYKVAQTHYEPCVKATNGSIGYAADWCFLETGLIMSWNAWAGAAYGAYCVEAKDYLQSKVDGFCVDKVEGLMANCLH